MFFGLKRDRFYFLGLEVFSKKNRGNNIVYFLCGIPVWGSHSEFLSIKNDFELNKNFDTHSFDEKIECLALKVFTDCKKNTFYEKNSIAYLATELYEHGGHTKCVENQIKALEVNYEQSVFLTKSPEIIASIKRIEQKVKLDFEDITAANYANTLIKLYNKILEKKPRVLFCFIHPDDVAGAMLLSLIKAYTNIKIIYCPHASHFPNLGTSFAELSLEGMQTTAYITHKLRNFPKTHMVGLLCQKKEEIKQFSEEQILTKRIEIGLNEDNLCSMSGGSAYKFFDGEKSEYFEMIKNLLESCPNLIHVVLSNFDENEIEIIEEIFTEQNARERLKIIPLQADFELLFKCADVFIDSFPVSSALTQTDLMKLKVATVVKINRENSHFSFHEYLPCAYPYAFESVSAMQEGVVRLLENKEERERVTAINYTHYLETFEGDVVTNKLIDIIENSEHLEQFYEKLDLNKNYKFEALGI